MRKVALIEYLVRIVPPSEEMSNEDMDEAARVLAATLEHKQNLRRMIEKRWIDGVDSLGEMGFTVEVIRLDGTEEG